MICWDEVYVIVAHDTKIGDDLAMEMLDADRVHFDNSVYFSVEEALDRIKIGMKDVDGKICRVIKIGDTVYVRCEINGYRKVPKTYKIVMIELADEM